MSVLTKIIFKGVTIFEELHELYLSFLRELSDDILLIVAKNYQLVNCISIIPGELKYLSKVCFIE